MRATLQLAADLANTLAQTFIEQSIEARQRAARQTYESLQVQLEELSHGLLRQEARAAAPSGSDRALEPVTREIDANRRFYDGDAAKGQ